MNDQMQNLARRAAACKHWRWMAGMALMGDTLLGKSFTRGTRAIGTQRQHPMGVGIVVDAINMDGERGGYVNALPDLTDPATLGCLLALVREAWGSPMLNTVQERGLGWIVADSLCCSMVANRKHFRGIEEAEALIAALEAAP